MNTSKALLDRVRAEKNWTYYKIAKEIEKLDKYIYAAKNGQTTLTEDDVITLCKLINEDPAQWFPGILADRTKREDKKAIWKRISKIVERAAVPVFIGFALLHAAPPADAAQLAGSQANVYYVKCRKWLRAIRDFCKNTPLSPVYR